MLQSLKANFTALFALHCDAFSLYSSDGELISSNASADRLRRICDWKPALAAPGPQAVVVEAFAGVAGFFELRVPSHEGDLRVHVDMTPVVVDGEVRAVSEVVRDIRLAIAEEDDAEETRLPTLAILYDRMSRLLIHMRRDGRPFAVHVIAVASDVLPESSIYTTIDRLLIDRLFATVRGTDTVARLGPHYVVVQAEMLEEDSTIAMVERLRGIMEVPMIIEDQAYGVKVTIGTALASRRTRSVEDLLTEADLSLSRSRVLPQASRLRRIERA